MKFLICIGLIFVSAPLLANDKNKELVEIVNSKLKSIEKVAAKQLQVSEVTFEPGSVSCIGTTSMDVGLVGTCTASGDLDEPNSSSLFSISVADKEEGSEERSFTVVRLTSEL